MGDAYDSEYQEDQEPEITKYQEVKVHPIHSNGNSQNHSVIQIPPFTAKSQVGGLSWYHHGFHPSLQSIN